MDLYAVFGNPINHSKSPMIHTAFAAQTEQRIEYRAIEAPIDAFKATICDFIANGGKGCNITVPFKEEAYQFAHELTARAKLAGAVNTLKVTAEGVVIGDNTDGYGLVYDLQHYMSLAGKRVLLVGAGGAARGVIGPLLEQNVKQIVIANRTFDKANQLAELFSSNGNIVATEFAQLDGKFDLIINSTSASLHGQLPPLSPALIHNEIICYDMMYAADKTKFNEWAEELGAAKTIDGLGMLVGQAAESFNVWRGVKPEMQSVLTNIRNGL